MDARSTAAYAEACGFIVEVTEAPAFEALAASHGVDVLHVGETTADFTFVLGGNIVRPLDALHETWSAPLRDFYAPAAGAA